MQGVTAPAKSLSKTIRLGVPAPGCSGFLNWSDAYISLAGSPPGEGYKSIAPTWVGHHLTVCLMTRTIFIAHKLPELVSGGRGQNIACPLNAFSEPRRWNWW